MEDDLRLRCTLCGSDVSPDDLMDVYDAYEQKSALMLEFGLSREPRLLYHKVLQGFGVGGGRIGYSMRYVTCGPVEETHASVQEQFIEWLWNE